MDDNQALIDQLINLTELTNHQSGQIAAIDAVLFALLEQQLHPKQIAASVKRLIEQELQKMDDQPLPVYENALTLQIGSYLEILSKKDITRRQP